MQCENHFFSLFLTVWKKKNTSKQKDGGGKKGRKIKDKSTKVSSALRSQAVGVGLHRSSMDRGGCIGGGGAARGSKR